MSTNPCYDEYKLAAPEDAPIVKQAPDSHYADVCDSLQRLAAASMVLDWDCADQGGGVFEPTIVVRCDSRIDLADQLEALAQKIRGE